MRHALAWATGLALLLALPAVAVLDHGRNKVEMRGNADGYVVDLSFPTPPRAGNDNAVVVKLSTARGKPLPDATVSVSATAQEAEMSHGSGGAGADSHGGGATQSLDPDGAMKMDGADDHAGMDMGKSSDHAGMDMGKSSDHAGMDMGGSGDHAGMDMGKSSDHATTSGNDSHAGANSASPASVLRPDRSVGVHKGLVSIGAGDASQLAVKFRKAGASHAASFEVDLARPRPRALVFGGFAAANILVLIAAFFIRRREAGARRRRTA